MAATSLQNRLLLFGLLLACLSGLLAQALFSFAVWDRLTFEEIAESIRNPYWISEGDLYDGISSNVVYYKLLDIYYQVRGFHLFAAKELRLGLTLLSVLAIGWLVLKYPAGRAAGILATFAALLSPTLLYFGSCQASFGIDLQFFPVIAGVWVCSLHLRACFSNLLFGVSVFLAVLVGACFPPGLFVIPALVLTDGLWHFSRTGCAGDFPRKHAYRLAAIPLAAAAALAVPFLLVNQPALLLHDAHVGSGIFRGGGNLTWRPMPILNALLTSARDLFVHGDSYQFHLPHPEFGTIVAKLSVAAVVAATALRLKGLVRMRGQGLRSLCNDSETLLLVFALVLLGTYLTLAHVSPNLPGLRRSAGLLIAFYLLFFLAARDFIRRFRQSPGLLRALPLAALILLPISHAGQLYRNTADLAATTRNDYPVWLLQDGTPTESLEKVYQMVLQGTPLGCGLVPDGCRYSPLYAALQLLHREKEPEQGALIILAEDPVTNGTIKVSKRLWSEYYWLH